MSIGKELLETLAAELLRRIQEGTATPRDLDVARQLLRDNGVVGLSDRESPLFDLASLDLIDEQ